MMNTNMVGVFPSTTCMKEVSVRNRHNGLGKPIKECSPRVIGAYGVDLTAAYLADRGYQILDRQWACQGSSVDLVCAKDDSVVLVEVRTRTARKGRYLSMEDLKVGYRRRQSFRNMAMLYLSKHIDHNIARCDVVAVQVVDGYEASLYHCTGVVEVSC